MHSSLSAPMQSVCYVCMYLKTVPNGEQTAISPYRRCVAPPSPQLYARQAPRYETRIAKREESSASGVVQH